MAQKSLKHPLVFEFVEHVLGVGALAVELLDLPAVHCVGQVGDVDRELMFVLVPNPARSAADTTLAACGRR